MEGRCRRGEEDSAVEERQDRGAGRTRARLRRVGRICAAQLERAAVANLPIAAVRRARQVDDEVETPLEAAQRVQRVVEVQVELVTVPVSMESTSMAVRVRLQLVRRLERRDLATASTSPGPHIAKMASRNASGMRDVSEQARFFSSGLA